MSEAVRKTAARVAILTRYKGANHPETIEAKRELSAAKLQAYVERVVATAPPLNQNQRDRIVRALGRQPRADR